MKALPLLLFFLHLNYVISHEFEQKRSFFDAKPLPKKDSKIIISRRLFKEDPKPLKTKKPSLEHKGYTAFPALASSEKKLYQVPSSLYFSLDHLDSQNRVKKVLEDDGIMAVRKKRSAPKSARPKNETKKGGKRTGEKKKRRRKQLRTKVKQSRRLIAARDAMIEDYPYVVSIQKNGEHWCAGAILNPILVITTANCMWKSNRMTRMRIRAGSRHTDHGGRVIRISEVVKHPNWSIRKNPDNDVALMLLEERLIFNDKLHGVDLPNRIMMPPFEDAWVTSWGAERRDGVVDKKAISLQLYHAHLMDRKKCNNVTQRFGVTVTDNFICLTQTGRRAPCTRDTGAPAVSDGVLWGLASWGIRKLCGTERFPAMFSYLASQTNMDFISNATRFLMSDQRLNPFPDRYPEMGP